MRLQGQPEENPLHLAAGELRDRAVQQATGADPPAQLSGFLRRPRGGAEERRLQLKRQGEELADHERQASVNTQSLRRVPNVFRPVPGVIVAAEIAYFALVRAFLDQRSQQG